MPCGSEEEVRRKRRSREREDGSWGSGVSARVVVVAGVRLNASQRFAALDRSVGHHSGRRIRAGRLGRRDDGAA